jgi:methylenetetrahydrofolate dehydrogenase (NADP+)/methenyltetrahydrofolate cyclohydrolase
MAVDQVKMSMDFIREFGKMALDMTTLFLPHLWNFELLERYGVEKGKHTVVIGRSHIVGRPMSILMGRKGFPGTQQLHLHTVTLKI